MPEIEELKLSVILTDNASVQIEAIKRSLRDLGGGEQMAAINRMSRETAELNKHIKELIEAITGGPRAMLHFVAGVGAVGTAIYATDRAMEKLLGSVGKFSNLSIDLLAGAQRAAIDPTTLRQLQEMYQRVMGQSGAAKATADAIKFNEAMADIIRGGGRVTDELMKLTRVWAPETMGRMQEFIATVRQLPDFATRWNYTQEFIAKEREMAEREHPGSGAVVEATIRNILGPVNADMVIEKLKPVDEAVAEMQRRRLQEGAKIFKQTQDIRIHWDHIVEMMSTDVMTKPLGRALQWINDMLAKWDPKHAPTFDERFGNWGQGTSPQGQGGTVPRNQPWPQSLDWLFGKGFVQPGGGGGDGGGAQKLMGGTDLNASLPNFGGIRTNENFSKMLKDPTLQAMGRRHMVDLRGQATQQQGVVEDRNDAERLLVEQLKRTNAMLSGEMPSILGKPLGLLDTQMGGLRGGLGGGIGAGGGGYGGGGYPTTPGGTPPSGGTPGTPGGGGLPPMVTPSSQAGPGGYPMPAWGTTTAGFGGGAGLGAAGGVAGAPGGPSGRALTPAERAGGGAGGGAGPSTGGGTAQTTGGAGGGNTWLAGQRAALMDEINRDPALRSRVAAVLDHETHGDQIGAQAVMETMVNRAMQLGHKSLWTTINSGFYGPVNRGEVGPPSASAIKIGNEAMKRVAEGSNITDFRDDQGTNRQGQPEVPKETPLSVAQVVRIGDYGPQKSEHIYYHNQASVDWATKMRERYRGTGGASATPQTAAQQPGPAGSGQEPYRGYNADLAYLRAHGGHDIGFGPNDSPAHDPELVARAAAAGREYTRRTGEQPRYGEMARSVAKQAEYYRNYITGRGGIAAPPGRSRHQPGAAIDLPDSPFRRWLYGPGGPMFGLNFPVRGDDPHMQVDPRFRQTLQGQTGAETQVAGPSQIATTPSVSPTTPPVDVSRSLYDKLQQQENDVRALRRLREEREKLDAADYHGFTQRARRQRLERGTFTRTPSDEDRSDLDRTQGRNIWHRVSGTGKISVNVNKSEGQKSVSQIGPFRKVRMQRHTMMKAAEHAGSQAGEATGAGHDPELDS